MNKIIVENDTMRFYSTPVPIPVGGSQWSKIFFMFSDEWEDLRKIAQFRQGELKRNVDIDSNNFCYVPNEMLPDMCGELSIVGYPQDTSSAVIATANSLMLSFVQGFESGGEPAVPPAPDLYQKLLKEFAESGGGNPDAVLYTEQELTEKQQAQARTNIRAFPAAVVPYFYKKNWKGVQYDARNAPAFSIIQEAGQDWESEGLPVYAFIKEIKFPCIKMESYMFVNGVFEAHFLDAAGVLWHCGMYSGGTSLLIYYLTKANASMIIHGKSEAQGIGALKVRLAEQEVNYIQIQNRQVEIEVSGGEVDFKLVSTGTIGTNGVLFFGTLGKVFMWGVWNKSKPNEIQVSLGSFTEVEQALKEVSLQTILRTWTNNELPA